MKHLKLFIILLIPIFLLSCDDLLNGEGELDATEVVKGLKTALEIGTDSSCAELNKKDAYYKTAFKILLPPEGDVVMDNLEILGNTSTNNIIFDLAIETAHDHLDGQIESVVHGVNRSVEDAAADAKPIFIDAITTMTVEDGLSILQGVKIDSTGTKSATNEFDSIAATHYLEYKTRTSLTTVFSPIIDAVLDKDLGLGFSANKAWGELVTYYNSNVAQLALGYTDVAEQGEIAEVSLGTHAVIKALDAIFNRVGNQERLIRKDPYQWALDIIQDIFGYVYEE